MLPFVNLQAQYRAYQAETDAAIQSVLNSCAFINGPEVFRLEEELAEFCGAGAAVACSSGTDAILLALLALELQPGDQVIVPDFTFFATAEMVALLGGIPVFADIDPCTFNLDPQSVSARITPATKGIIAVSMFGQCADFHALRGIAGQHGLWLMDDAAQSFGATSRSEHSCNLTDITTTSFFPAKPLGCYGDGGAVFTRHPELAARVRLLLNHGSTRRYHHEKVGINGRLDSLQAAILRVKLRHFSDELRLRDQLAEQYTHHFRDQPGISVPVLSPGNTSSWAQYTLRVVRREAFIDDLTRRGIPTSIHYPTPVHAQPCFSGLPGNASVSNPAAEQACREVVSLPMCAFADTRAIFSALGR